MENINFKAALTAPNPFEVVYWVDLLEDPQGGTIKYYNYSLKNWEPIKAASKSIDITPLVTDITNLKNNKVDKISGKVLSTNDYTTVEKTKLDSITAGAKTIVINNTITSTSAVEALSANIGKVLNDKIVALTAKVATLETTF